MKKMNQWKLWRSILLFMVGFNLSIYGQTFESTFGYRNMSLNMVKLPGTMLDYSFNLGVPVLNNISFGAASEKFNLGALLAPTENGLDLAKNLESIKDKLDYTQYITTDISMDLFYLGFRKEDNMYYVGSGVDYNLEINYPKELLTFLIDGNALAQDENEKNINLSGISVDHRLTGKIYVGYNKKIKTSTGDFSLGVKFNLLSSGGVYQYKGESLNIKTIREPNQVGQRVIFEGRGLAQVSSLDWQDGERTPQLGQTLENPISNAFSFRNMGFSTDFGVFYETEKSKTYLGFSNIGGFINSANGSYSKVLDYEGLTIDGIDFKEIKEDESLFEEWKDHVTFIRDSILFPTKDQPDQFVINLPLGFKSAYMYSVTPMHNFGAQFNYRFFQDRGGYNVSTFYLMDIDHAFQAKSSVGYSPAGLGFGLGMFSSMGPFQFHISSSNVVDMIMLKNFQEGYLNFGLSLAIDRLFLYQEELLPSVRDYLNYN